MNTPIVSIITPTYNHERYISACIESVINQTFPYWEMIIVDDGSTDGTEVEVRKYAAEDNRIRYIRQENLGPWRLAETYNKALGMARGDFIAILEGDDLWPDTKLRQSVAALERIPHSAMAYGRAQLVNTDGTNRGLNNLPAISVDRWNMVSLSDLLLRRASILPVTSLIRHSFLRRIGGFQGYPDFPAVDLPTWLALVQMGPFLFADEVWGYWRIHSNQITSSRIINLPARSMCLDLFQRLDPSTRESLGMTRDHLISAHRPFVADEQWSLAMRSCDHREWGNARTHLIRGFRYGGTFRRIESTLALPLTYAHVNPAAFLRLGNRMQSGVRRLTRPSA